MMRKHVANMAEHSWHDLHTDKQSHRKVSVKNADL